MAYEGDVLDQCGLINVDLSTIAVVAVSGSGPNVCGHLILFTPSRGGYYFHVAGGVNTAPRYMSEANYRRYLSGNRKRELRRIPVTLPKPREAEALLEQLLSDPWFWGALPHNCVSFCEAVIRAGGGPWGSYSNCPTIATDGPEYTIQLFLNQLESAIYRLYGAPR